MRIVWFLLLAVVGCRIVTGRWPWQFLKTRSTRSQAVFRARKLLGVRGEASRQEIVEAHKRLLAMVHPDRGGTNGQVHEANAARDLLIDELPDGT
jgi:DnaJ homolog subfamily C member 19